LKKKYRFILYFAVLIIFAIWIGMWILQNYYPATKPIERFFLISVPKDASEVQAQYNWVFQGGAFFLQFKLSSQGFDDLKLKLCGDQEFGTEYNREASRSWGEITPSWWLPDPTSISVSAECVIPGELIPFDFFVDRSEANLFDIYMRGAYG
jgi:hypothetical protein